MEFYEVIDRRKTSREWTDKEVDFQAIKRILTAGMKAPSWDHYRNWQFIVLHTREEKENAFAYAKHIADQFDLSRYDGKKLNLAQKMYAYAMPRQFTMLVECPYVIVPLFRCAKLNGEWVSKLNPLTTAWCVAENIMLATIDEGLGYSLRIPLNREHDVVLETLGVPKGLDDALLYRHRLPERGCARLGAIRHRPRKQNALRQMVTDNDCTRNRS